MTAPHYARFTWVGNRIDDADMAAMYLARGKSGKPITLQVAEAVSKYVKEVVPDMMKQHRKLTERERGRMADVYAMGPLTYIKEVDDPLFELDLLEFYDDEKTAVEAKHNSDFFYEKSGVVKKEWYGKEEHDDEKRGEVS